jgi:translation elongation factor EF-1alpha
VANLHPERQNGRAIEERDVTRAYAEYAYSLTDGNGSTQEFVAHIECRTLVPDSAVFVIHAYMPRTDLDVQRQDLEELLAGLVLP